MGLRLDSKASENHDGVHCTDDDILMMILIMIMIMIMIMMMMNKIIHLHISNEHYDLIMTM